MTPSSCFLQLSRGLPSDSVPLLSEWGTVYTCIHKYVRAGAYAGVTTVEEWRDGDSFCAVCVCVCVSAYAVLSFSSLPVFVSALFCALLDNHLLRRIISFHYYSFQWELCWATLKVQNTATATQGFFIAVVLKCINTQCLANFFHNKPTIQRFPTPTYTDVRELIVLQSPTDFTKSSGPVWTSFEVDDY